MTTNTTYSKGSLAAVLVLGKEVQLWYNSPTGDSTDSVIHSIVCLTEEQAQEVGTLHKEVWSL